MLPDIVGPDPRVGASALLDAVVPVLADLRSLAEEIDVTGVKRQHVDALARAGFLAAAAPTSQGGLGASGSVLRELHEQLAAASGSAWFVVTQHRASVEAAGSSPNPAVHERWSRRLAAGTALGAVSFAHLRRPGSPSVRATADGDGWRFSGRLDWITSWGLADALLLMAETDDGYVIQALVDAEETAGLRITGPLALAAMSGTSTVGAELVEFPVDAEGVACVVSKASWLADDTYRTANASPAVFGLLRACLTGLQEIGERRAAPEAVALAHRWADEARQLRAKAYALIDGVAADEQLEERVLLRAESLHLLQRATAALVTVRGGRAMMMDSAAQRWAREALFLLVQAQTLPLRQNLLALYSRFD